MSNLSNLDEWLFNFNSHKNEWRAVKREHFLELFSNYSSENVIRSSSKDTLVAIICLYNGDTSKIPL